LGTTINTVGGALRQSGVTGTASAVVVVAAVVDGLTTPEMSTVPSVPPSGGSSSWPSLVQAANRTTSGRRGRRDLTRSP
jgi:hypothetical protein